MDKPNVCIVSFPMPSSGVTSVFLRSLMEILKPISNLIVISNNLPKVEGVDLYNIGISMHRRDSIRPKLLSTLLQIIKIIIIQSKICYMLIKLQKRIDIVIFYVGGANLFPAVLVSKILRKRTVFSAIGLGSMSYRRASKNLIQKMYSHALYIFEKMNLILADKILVESKSVVNFLGLDKYNNKIIDQGARYIDIKIFNIKTKLSERENVVGYIGRLVEEKGIMNFLKAIPLILDKNKDVKFLIGGNGPLFEQIRKWVNDTGYKDNIILIGWTPHEKLPDYLNKLKLLVLPSYSEGLPTVVLEAMACGTPVLATPVGGIPDVVKDGETGFIMESNSPECIAENVIRVLNHSDLEKIARNARKLAESEFGYERAVERWRKILEKCQR